MNRILLQALLLSFGAIQVAAFPAVNHCAETLGRGVAEMQKIARATAMAVESKISPLLLLHIKATSHATRFTQNCAVRASDTGQLAVPHRTIEFGTQDAVPSRMKTRITFHIPKSELPLKDNWAWTSTAKDGSINQYSYDGLHLTFESKLSGERKFRLVLEVDSDLEKFRGAEFDSQWPDLQELRCGFAGM